MISMKVDLPSSKNRVENEGRILEMPKRSRFSNRACVTEGIGVWKLSPMNHFLHYSFISKFTLKFCSF